MFGGFVILSPMESPYFKSRYTPDLNRSRVWKAICEYVQPFVPLDGVVIDVGAGYLVIPSTRSAIRFWFCLTFQPSGWLQEQC